MTVARLSDEPVPGGASDEGPISDSQRVTADSESLIADDMEPDLLSENPIYRELQVAYGDCPRGWRAGDDSNGIQARCHGRPMPRLVAVSMLRC
jgi:hypothetical protein